MSTADEMKLEPVAVSMAAAAELLGVSRASIYTLADRDPTFPAFHVGSCRRVNVAALRRWCDAQVENGGGDAA